MNAIFFARRVRFVLIVAILLSVVVGSTQIFFNHSGEFRISQTCLSLAEEGNTDLDTEGSIWYEEDYILGAGRFGLHWIGNTESEAGTLPVSSTSRLYISPDGKEILFYGYEEGMDILDAQIYHLFEDKSYEVTNIKRMGELPVWTEDNKTLGTDWDFHENRISVIVTDIDTGTATRYDHYDGGMSSEPMAKVGRNGLLASLCANHFEAHIVVYDIWNDREVAQYKNISYGVRPSWYGFLLNPEGTRILAISSLWGEEYDGKQQELFEVEIGKAPVQVTNFHAKHPYFLIYDLNFGGQRWSPDNRWVVIKAIPSETREINEITATKVLFLVDLKNKVAYPFCEPTDGFEHVAWSPDSRFFALSIKDKLWVVEPTTKKSRLLLERPGIPLQVLGWTSP